MDLLLKLWNTKFRNIC